MENLTSLEMVTESPLALLLAVFCVLVALLYFYGRVLKYQHNRSPPVNKARNKERLENWLTTYEALLPTEDAIIEKLNSIADNTATALEGGVQWRQLRIERFLPSTPLPQFEIQSIKTCTEETIVFDSVVRWPDCAPGFEVSVLLDEEKIVCHMQVDWMLMFAECTLFRNSNEGVSLSWKQTSPPVTALSCMVISPPHWKANIDISQPLLESPDAKDSEGVASSVAEGILKVLKSFQLTAIELTTQTITNGSVHGGHVEDDVDRESDDQSIREDDPLTEVIQPLFNNKRSSTSTDEQDKELDESSSITEESQSHTTTQPQTTISPQPHITSSPRPYTGSPQPHTGSPQPHTDSPQPYTGSPRPPDSPQPHTTGSAQPHTTDSPQLRTASSPQPRTADSPQAINVEPTNDISSQGTSSAGNITISEDSIIELHTNEDRATSSAGDNIPNGSISKEGASTLTVTNNDRTIDTANSPLSSPAIRIEELSQSPTQFMFTRSPQEPADGLENRTPSLPSSPRTTASPITTSTSTDTPDYQDSTKLPTANGNRDQYSPRLVITRVPLNDTKTTPTNNGSNTPSLNSKTIPTSNDLKDTEDMNNNSDKSSPSSWRRSFHDEQEESDELGTSFLSTSQLRVLTYSDEDLTAPGKSPFDRSRTLSMRSYDTDSPMTDASGRFLTTVVFEVQDGGRKKHIVAMNPTHANRLRKQLGKYTKLHIYSDHTFIATHIKSKHLCAVCGEKISGLFGKQAYVCRDCNMHTHKSCHHKMETNCSRSQVSTLNLIYPEKIPSYVSP